MVRRSWLRPRGQRSLIASSVMPRLLTLNYHFLARETLSYLCESHILFSPLSHKSLSFYNIGRWGVQSKMAKNIPYTFSMRWITLQHTALNVGTFRVDLIAKTVQSINT